MRALQIEFIKLLRPSTYILWGLVLLYFIGNGQFMLQLSNAGLDKAMVLHAMDAGQVDTVLLILFGIFFIMNIGKEYSENTLRRSIIEGYTRSKFFTGKLLFLLVASVGVLLLQKLVFLISAGIAGGFKDAMDSFTVAGVLAQLFRIVFNAIFAFFLVFVTRSIAFSIVTFIFWNWGEGALQLFLKFKFPESDYGMYLPFNALGHIVGADGAFDYKFVLLASAYMVAMVVAAYGLLANRDIK